MNANSKSIVSFHPAQFEDANGPLPLYRQEPADASEAVLRFLLVLCLLISLLLCGWRIGSGWQNLPSAQSELTPRVAQATGHRSMAESPAEQS